MSGQSYRRIVSLVPSLTELLFDLGLSDKLVGRTRFCVHPGRELEQVPIIGGTKNPHVDKILNLEPDIVVANREENRKEVIGELHDHCEVLLTDIASVQDALITITEIGGLFDVEDKARKLVGDIQDRFEERPRKTSIRTAYFIWRKPWMTVGGDTYINNVLSHWSLENVFGDRNRYPVIDLPSLAGTDPELILLSSEPFPFKEEHADEIRSYCQSSTIRFVDGQWFSWYGSRMKLSFHAMNEWRKSL